MQAPYRTYSTIPGGRENIAQSYGQTVVGVFNRAVGSSVASDFNTQPIPFPRGDDPLFIVGNGTSGSTRSNAFEVSNNGHSTVYDVNGESVNGNGTPIPPLSNPRNVYYGSTYTDNVVYAWGDITPSAVGTGIVVNGSFGVKEVIRNFAGDYTIKLITADPITGNQSNITKASITANIVQPYDDNIPVCGFIFPSEIVQVGTTSQFKIRITYKDCIKEDRRFMFKVVGRP